MGKGRGLTKTYLPTCFVVYEQRLICVFSKQPGSKWPGFLINRSGLPFDELTWNELWDFAGHLYPEAKVTFREIQSAPLLAEVPYPVPPSIRYGSCAYPVEQQSFGTGLSTEYFFLHSMEK